MTRISLHRTRTSRSARSHRQSLTHSRSHSNSRSRSRSRSRRIKTIQQPHTPPPHQTSRQHHTTPIDTHQDPPSSTTTSTTHSSSFPHPPTPRRRASIGPTDFLITQSPTPPATIPQKNSTTNNNPDTLSRRNTTLGLLDASEVSFRFSIGDSRSRGVVDADDWHRRTGSVSNCYIRSSQERGRRFSAAGMIGMPPVPVYRERGRERRVDVDVDVDVGVGGGRGVGRGERGWRRVVGDEELEIERRKARERERVRRKRDKERRGGRSGKGVADEEWERGRESVRRLKREMKKDVYPNYKDRIDRVENGKWDRFDALALVRGLPAIVRGWVHIAEDVKGKNVKGWRRMGGSGRKFRKYWAEVRGGIVLCYDENGVGGDDVAMVFTLSEVLVDTAKRGGEEKGNWESMKGFLLGDRVLRLYTRQGVGMTFRFGNTATKRDWTKKMFQATTKVIAAAKPKDFEVIQAVGKGASGKVFLVRDIRTNNYLALKVVNKEKAYRNALAFKHIVNERLILEMCHSCPFLVELRYAFQTPKYLYLATDFYDGGDLYSLLRAYGGRLDERIARYVIAEVILALESLHERDIVYRDLKPENIVIDGNGHIRLADFGLAKRLEHLDGHLTKTVCGTSAYAAPEMLGRNPYCQTLDLWSLGVFIYHCLMGTPPWNMREKTFPEMLIHMQSNPIQFPYPISDNARRLIQELIVADPRMRLTCDELKRHPFFSGVDWKSVAAKEKHPDGIGPVDLANIMNGAEPHSDGDAPVSSAAVHDWLMRNFDKEEWSDVGFSFEMEREGRCSFPAFVTGGVKVLDTTAIAGWNWTCPPPAGYYQGSRRRRSSAANRYSQEEPFGRSSVHETTTRRSLHRIRENIGSLRRRSLHF